jgi:hypothetical protein
VVAAPATALDLGANEAILAGTPFTALILFWAIALLRWIVIDDTRRNVAHCLNTETTAGRTTRKLDATLFADKLGWLGRLTRFISRRDRGAGLPAQLTDPEKRTDGADRASTKRAYHLAARPRINTDRANHKIEFSSSHIRITSHS